MIKLSRNHKTSIENLFDNIIETNNKNDINKRKKIISKKRKKKNSKKNNNNILILKENKSKNIIHNNNNFIQFNAATGGMKKGRSKVSNNCKNDGEGKEIESNAKKKKKPKKLNDIKKYNNEEINTISILDF